MYDNNLTVGPRFKDQVRALNLVSFSKRRFILESHKFTG